MLCHIQFQLDVIADAKLFPDSPRIKQHRWRLTELTKPFFVSSVGSTLGPVCHT